MATALETNVLEAQPREAGTKNDARRVRREGKIPAVVYGAGKDSLCHQRGSARGYAHSEFGNRPQHDFRSDA